MLKDTKELERLAAATAERLTQEAAGRLLAIPGLSATSVPGYPGVWTLMLSADGHGHVADIRGSSLAWTWTLECCTPGNPIPLSGTGGSSAGLSRDFELRLLDRIERDFRRHAALAGTIPAWEGVTQEALERPFKAAAMSADSRVARSAARALASMDRERMASALDSLARLAGSPDRAEAHAALLAADALETIRSAIDAAAARADAEAPRPAG
jgi:hypothetical protein